MADEIGIIWAIASGVYSDYRIDAVCGDRATADAWATAMNGNKKSWGSDYRVEELTFVPAGMEPHTVTTYRHNVILWDDGSIEDNGPHENTEYPVDCLFGPPPKRPHVRFVRAPVYRNKGGRLEVTGDSAEAVEKVFSERIAAWKAGSWITRDLREWSGDASELRLHPTGEREDGD